MARIQILSQAVANQISAGEVIERPASVVKELVENSIDAGSNNIQVIIDKGGREKIQVKDNGIGIKNNEVEIAFSRYATSKIRDINDIYSLQTLGFRGEGLASIASVSKVELITREQDEKKATYLKINGGELIDKKVYGSSTGTDIKVYDIFYNTPARYKYLKKINTEFSHISNIVIKEALSHPEIKFNLIHNNKNVLQTPGSGRLKDTIYAIYGKELSDELIDIHFEQDYIQVKGYITSPSMYRSSRIYEKFFVNKRAVENIDLSRAVEEGYSNLLPPGKYPIVFLFIKLNPILVDVNVHPAKKEIKFSRRKIIKNIVKNGIKDGLKNIDKSPRMKIFKPNKVEDNKKKRLIDYKPNLSNNNEKYKKELFNNKDDYKEKNYNSQQDKLKYKDNVDINKDNKDLIKEESSKFPIKQIIGQIHTTYILAEGEDGLFIIDQHTAHERILYEKIKRKFNSNKNVSQSLLIPLNIELSIQELEIVKKHKKILDNLGFEIELFGVKSIIVQYVPDIIKKRSAKKVVMEIIDYLMDNENSPEQSQLIDEIIKYMSCRSAVKSGDSLNYKEIESLIIDLFNTSNPYRCPHGRPVMIHLTNNDLEKGLGRK